MSGVSRRTVLKGVSALVVGFGLVGPGAASAARFVRDPEADIRRQALADGGLDAWLVIDEHGIVTVYSGKVELGTGIATALRQVAAGTLDVAFARTSIVQADTGRTPDLGYTAGSKTLQKGGKQLAEAGRIARGVLIQRAARRLGVPVNTLRTHSGQVLAEGDARRAIDYADLVADGFDVGFKQDVDVPPLASTGPLGRPVPRMDIPAKVAGRFTYLQDLVVDGLWHGRVVRPPTTGAIDPSAARLVSVDASRLPAAARVVRRGNFLGVVAPTEWQAIQASQRLRAVWDKRMTLPAEDGLFEYLESLPSKQDVLVDRGDVDRTLANAKTTLEATYHWPFQAHDSIGPSCAVASITDDAVTVWSGTQGAYPLRAALADLLGRDARTVRVIYVEASGCYGHNGADDAAADAVLLSRAVGRPVRVQWSRADEHGWAPKGPAMRMRLAAALDEHKAIRAWRFDNLTPTHSTRPSATGGAATLLAGQLIRGAVPAGHAVGGDRNARTDYDFRTQRVTVNWLETAKLPLRPSALRTLGGIQNAFANESFIDEIAHAAGADPLAFRLHYAADARGRAVLKAVAHMSGWQPRDDRPGDWRDAGARGRGVSWIVYENENARVATVVNVVVGRAGIRLTHVWVAHDCGRIVNPDGLRNQIEGNVIQAANRTLNEAVRFDPFGVTSLEWSRYPLTAFDAVPEIDIHLIDRPDQPMLGAGEATSATLPAAIANAVFDACGLRLRQVPFTRERIAALRADV